MEKEKLKIKVTEIVNYYYPYKKPKEIIKLKKGLQFEIKIKQTIKYVYYQYPLNYTFNLLYNNKTLYFEVRGIIDFVDITNNVHKLIEVKNYPITRYTLPRVKLQLNIYRLLYKYNTNINDNKIELVAIDKRKRKFKIQKMDNYKIINLIYKYIESRLKLQQLIM